MTWSASELDRPRRGARSGIIHDDHLRKVILRHRRDWERTDFLLRQAHFNSAIGCADVLRRIKPSRPELVLDRIVERVHAHRVPGRSHAIPELAVELTKGKEEAAPATNETMGYLQRRTDRDIGPCSCGIRVCGPAARLP